jgi:hypothetical protein
LSGDRNAGNCAGSPDADAVDLSVVQIHSTNACEDFLSVSRVIEIDSKVETQNALVIAEVEMMVLSPFTAAHVGVARPGKNGDLKREE